MSKQSQKALHLKQQYRQLQKRRADWERWADSAGLRYTAPPASILPFVVPILIMTVGSAIVWDAAKRDNRVLKEEFNRQAPECRAAAARVAGNPQEGYTITLPKSCTFSPLK